MTRRESPLRERSFRILWAAGLLDDTINWMLITAIPIFVYRLTGSALVTAVVFIIELVPGVVAGPLAGVTTDRVDRRRLLLSCSLIQAVLVSALMLVNSAETLWLLYVVIASRAACAQFVLTAKNALLPVLVGADRAAAATNLVVLNTNLGRLIGSFVGGVAVAAGLFGVAAASVVALLLTAALIGRVRVPAAAASVPSPVPSPDLPPRPGRRGPIWVRTAIRDWVEGLRVITGDRKLLFSFVSAALCSVGQGLFVVLFVVFVATVLNGSDAEIGLLRGVQGIGGIAGGLALGALGARLQPRPLLTWGALSFAVLAFVVWNAPLLDPGFGFYVGMFIAVGLPGGAYLAGVLGMVQQRVPAAYLGRAMSSCFTTLNGAQVVGMTVAGLWSDLLGPTLLLNGQAALYLVAGLITLVGVGVRNRPERPGTRAVRAGVAGA